MTAERFLELFRHLGGDADLSDAGEVVLTALPALLDVVSLRVEAIGKPALVEALEHERALAEAQLRARGIEPRCAAITVTA